ncbi:MAG: peptide chain release factor 1 [Planctomycetota bacterium]|nr:MAG: peptide chain release factor 1 [Planctomycetota bacterium]
MERQISAPDVASDADKFIPLSKEQGKLKPIVAKYREYKGVLAGIADAESLLADEKLEADFRSLAEEELGELGQKKERLLAEIKDSLVMADDAAVGSVIMEIRPGTGGEEASLFVRDLYNMYTKFAEKRGWKVEMIQFSPTEMGGFRELIMNVKGPGVWSELGYEGGGHRVQRVPETESQGRVHTSAATVAVLPEPEEIDIQINPDDVIEHVSRSSGPGGQSVNKLSSAVRLEHVPTGITVSMQDEKSQHKNRAKAWRILRSRIYEMHRQKERQQRDKQRKTMIGSGDRSQKIRTYNFPQNRVTDHRIKLSFYNLDKIILGEMDEIVGALQDYDKQQRLENL